MSRRRRPLYLHSSRALQVMYACLFLFLQCISGAIIAAVAANLIQQVVPLVPEGMA